MSISMATGYIWMSETEAKMLPQTTSKKVQWQDLKVAGEVELVQMIAKQNGWKDCEIFGYGDMLTQPVESKGWNLIPADKYEYSIPVEGVNRIVKIMNAGIRIQGVIIADDLRKKEPLPAPKKPRVRLPSAASVFSQIGKGLGNGLHRLVAILGSLLLGLVIIAAVVLFGYALFTIPLVVLPILFIGMAMTHDPKLIILVDDGNGGTAWVSVLTWYD
jgi:hypothetical protein